MDVQSLQKLTVAQLREQAKELPGATGISAMKKDDLIALIAGQGESAKPSGAALTGGGPQPTGKTEIKQCIRALKAEKREALAAKDRQRIRACNRQIHHFKRVLRKMARAAA